MLTLQRIDELAAGIDYHLQRLEDFSDSLKDIKYTLQELRRSQEKSHSWELEKIRTEMEFLRSELEKRGLPQLNEYEKSFQKFKEMIRSEEWPAAVDPKSICINEDMAFQRAQNILDLVIGEFLQDKSFLDFGCGEGHVIMRSLTQNPKVAIGYDIDLTKCKFVNDHFLSEFDMVALKGPYDIILLQDVLDHLENISPIEVLKKLKKILTKDGRIYLRNHPWCSRHGSHLYTKINKAFVHLAFDESELSRLGGYINEHTLRIFNPASTYKHWFQEAGFKVCSEVPIARNIENYFKNENLLKDKLLSHWNGDETQMINDMQVEFIEYVLEPILDQQII